MRSNEVYLRHILDEIDYLLGRTQDLAYERFLKDETIRRAFARSIEIIGEASKNVSADFQKKRTEIDWKGMSGMRDVLIHR